MPRPFGLFTEDFDHPRAVRAEPGPEPGPEPDPPPPDPLAEAVAAARLAGHAQGVQAGLAQAADAREEAVCALLRDIAARMDDAAEAVRAQGEDNAFRIAKLVLGRVHTAFPLLATRHGPSELAELARTLVPTLTGKPRVVVHVNSQSAAGVQAAIDRLEPENKGNFEVVMMDDVLPCDIRLHWKDGKCVRDVGGLWQRMGEALARQGLLDLLGEDPPPPLPAPSADPPPSPGDTHAR